MLIESNANLERKSGQYLDAFGVLDILLTKLEHIRLCDYLRELIENPDFLAAHFGPSTTFHVNDRKSFLVDALYENAIAVRNCILSLRKKVNVPFLDSIRIGEVPSLSLIDIRNKVHHANVNSLLGEESVDISYFRIHPNPENASDNWTKLETTLAGMEQAAREFLGALVVLFSRGREA